MFLQAPSPPVAWAGGFLFSCLGSVLELIRVEAQGELGFGMRIKGLWGLPGWCPKGERIGRESSSARRWALSLKRAQEPPFVFPREARLFFLRTW